MPDKCPGLGMRAVGIDLAITDVHVLLNGPKKKKKTEYGSDVQPAFDITSHILPGRFAFPLLT